MEKENKRIILVGPTCAGKTYIRDQFRKRGFKIDVSYTTRAPREGEINGNDYIFVTEKYFKRGIERNWFYEWVKYGDNYYGTGMDDWKKSKVFIMETIGISKIKPEDRQNCLIIYVNTPLSERIIRMKKRGWNNEKIVERLNIDDINFCNFKNFDLKIESL